MGAGADDVETVVDGSVEVLAEPEAFDAVNDALQGAGLEPELAQVVERPSNETPVSDEDAEKVMRLIDALEELSLLCLWLIRHQLARMLVGSRVRLFSKEAHQDP